MSESKSFDQKSTWMAFLIAGVLLIGGYTAWIEFTFIFERSLLLGIIGVLLIPITAIVTPLYVGFVAGEWLATILTVAGIIWLGFFGSLVDSSELK